MLLKRCAPLALLALLAAGCGGMVTYVHPGDPVMSICQSANVQNLGNLQTAVDEANNTADGGGLGTPLGAGDVSGLQQAARDYEVAGAEVAITHPGFAAALQSEAQEFAVAASATNGLTTDSVAIAVDRFAAQIQDDCAAFRVGPAPARPGPGLWDWGLFWLVTSAYLVMTVAAGYLIAIAQRSKPRKKRLSPHAIFWLSTVWWVTIFTAVAGIYRNSLASATLSADEKKDDRLKALAKENKRLEDQLRKPLK